MAKIIDLDTYTGMMSRNMSDGPTVIAISSADAALNSFMSILDNAKGYRSVGLLNFSYSTWRTSAVLSKAGNTSQVPTLLRLAIEASLYAHLFKESASWRDVWEKREICRKSKDKFRKEGLSAANSALRRGNEPLAIKAKTLYDQMIDIGGHPNATAVDLMTTLDFKEGEQDGMAYFSQLSDHDARYLANLNIISTADVILSVAQLTWPERHTLYGIQAHHDKMKRDAYIYTLLNQEKD